MWIMGVRVILKCTLDEDVWASAETLAAMTDEEIIALAHEDVFFLVKDATWTVERD